MYISEILNWRETTAVMFKVPKKKLSQRMQILIKEIQRKLYIKRSPEELMCQIAIKKCFQERDQLITQQHKQYVE